MNDLMFTAVSIFCAICLGVSVLGGLAVIGLMIADIFTEPTPITVNLPGGAVEMLERMKREEREKARAALDGKEAVNIEEASSTK